MPSKKFRNIIDNVSGCQSLGFNQTGNVGIGHMNRGEIRANAKIAGIINESVQQDLTQVATEIKQLLEQLSQTYPTKTFSQKAVVVEKTIENIESNPTLKQKMIGAIKAMEIEALIEAIHHPVVNILRAGLEAYK